MVEEKRDEMILNNTALVHSIAKRFLNRGAEYEDIFQAGCIGLIKAVDNFDESRGYCFSTYAVPVIMGEIKRIFRDGGQIKISRSIKEKSFYVQSQREKFLIKEEREPTVSELSEITGIEENELSEILNASCPVISLSTGESGEEELDIPVDDNERIFDRITVRCALNGLNQSERLLIKYRFFEGKTQTETAKLLKISQVQVSRKEKATLKKLREVLF